MKIPVRCARCSIAWNDFGDVTRTDTKDGYAHYRCATCAKETHIPPDLQIPMHDPVNHPSHYTWLPKGVEVIDIAELFQFNRGNALKYIMRAGRKGGADELEDLQKARFYLDREIANIETQRKVTTKPAPSHVAGDFTKISSHPYQGTGGPCTFSVFCESREYCEQPEDRHMSSERASGDLIS